MMRCPDCCASVPDGSQCCPVCGTELTAPSRKFDDAPVRGFPEVLSVAAPAVPEQEPGGVSDPGVASPALNALPSASARLTVKQGGALTTISFPITGSVVIGRFDLDTGPVDVDLASVPGSEHVSRRHAQIWQDPSGIWFAKDLGSSNGTFIRRAGHAQFERISGDQEIRSGDEIAFGNLKFAFETTG